jgi:hypothetical protein
LVAVLVVGLMFGTVANSVAVSPPTTTYTVKVTQTGIPSTQSWSATLNGVTNSAKGSTITFTGVAAGSYYLYTYTFASTSSTDIQYVPSNTYNYITVPNSLAVAVAWTTQYYTTFSVSPAGSGTAYPGTAWYNAGSEVALSAETAAGYTFSKWSVSPTKSFVLGSSSAEASEVQVNAVGVITAQFKATTSSATFDEVGLPASTSWGVTFDSAATSGTSTSIKTAAHDAGAYSWTIAPVTVSSTTEYVAFPSSGSMTLPNQPTQEIVFVEEVQVTFAITPSPSGTVTPTGVGYYPVGSVVPIEAFNTASYVFTKWSANETKVGLGVNSNSGNNATVKASATVTATFKAGSECATCSLTFNELGLPAGTAWGVTFGPTNYVSSTSAITLTGLTASNSWSAFEPLSSGTFDVVYIPAYIGTTYTGSGYYSIGQTSSIEIVYTEYAWVSVVAPAAGTQVTVTTGWFQMGGEYAISAIGTPYYAFSSWTSSGKNLTLGSGTTSSTTLKVTGTGTLTVNFQQPTVKLHFQEFGLPAGTTWGVSLGSPTAVWYTSHTAWLNITAVAYGAYSWGPLTNIGGGTGLQWTPSSYYSYVVVPFETYESVVYGEQASVAFAITGTAGGTITPTTTTWYWLGSIAVIEASDGTGATFASWSDTAGTGTITSTSSASTFVTIAGTGTVSAKFT